MQLFYGWGEGEERSDNNERSINFFTGVGEVERSDTNGCMVLFYEEKKKTEGKSEV